jgi:hypothetical protein
VLTAGNAGIYVSIMLFEGFGLHLTPPPDNVAGHPFHAANNVNQIGIASIVDYQVLPLDARVQAFQEAYIQKVIGTVHDLPNVLYEVANESSGARYFHTVGNRHWIFAAPAKDRRGQRRLLTLYQLADTPIVRP